MKYVLLCLLTSLIGFTLAQTEAIHSNFVSAGTTTGKTINSTHQLYSVVGQPITSGAGNFTQPQAGFLKAGNYIIVVDDTYPPVILFTPLTNFTQGASTTFTAQITDVNQITSAKLNSRGISGDNFQVSNLTATNDNYSIPINSLADAIGLEYFFTATDAAPTPNNARLPATGSYFTYLVNPSVDVPITSFGSEVTNYRIIAFPYQTSNNTVLSLFDELGEYSNTRWRMATYNNTTDLFPEYPGEFTTLERGKGYWMIIKNTTQITVGPVEASHENRSNLFELTLRPGYNLIGNPYPVEISWADTKTLNNDPAIGELQTYTGGWENSISLPPFQGGFVNYSGSSPKTIKIPFKGQTAVGGRKQDPENLWRINLHVFQAGTFNKTGGFGMAPDANEDKDNFDGFNPPRFLDGPQITFKNANADFTPSLSVVNNQDEYVWHFQVSGKPGELTELKWNTDQLERTKELFLLDEQTLDIVNMKLESNYHFQQRTNATFKLFYGNDVMQKIFTEHVMVTEPYPNAVRHGEPVTYKLNLPETQITQLEILNMQGATIFNQSSVLSKGLHEISFAAPTISGTYISRVSVGNKIVTHKLLVL